MSTRSYFDATRYWTPFYKAYTNSIPQSAQAKAEAAKAEAKMEQVKHEAAKKLEEARREGNQAVDKFDKTVTQAASDSKSWLGGWFGGK
jgi:F0F1-type ATP synthase membrane subunit b/b'